jgi:hypothetical protein
VLLEEGATVPRGEEVALVGWALEWHHTGVLKRVLDPNSKTGVSVGLPTKERRGLLKKVCVFVCVCVWPLPGFVCVCVCVDVCVCGRRGGGEVRVSMVMVVLGNCM